jgi:hypothetical protein
MGGTEVAFGSCKSDKIVFRSIPVDKFVGAEWYRASWP